MIPLSKEQKMDMQKITDWYLKHTKDKQILYCIQELSELTQQLTKVELGISNNKKVYEELFDAYWTIGQIYQMLVTDLEDTALFNKIVSTQIDRSMKRLNL